MAIIKCPECNHEVSDQAVSCPYCGVAIADNTTTCPDCGKVLLRKDTVCSNCGCALAPVEQKGRRAGYREYASKKQKRTRSRRKSYTGVWIFLTIIFIIALIAGGFMLYRYMSHQKSMEEDYVALRDNKQIEAYDCYLANYPESPYVRDVVERLGHLKEVESEWQEVLPLLSKEKFVAFLEKNPDSAYDEQCRALIDSLDWETVRNDNTAGAYAHYLDDHPDGRYVEEARKGQDFVKNNPVTWEEVNSVRMAARAYFEAVSHSDRNQLSNVTVSQLFTSTNEWMEKLHKEYPYAAFWLQSAVTLSKAPNKETDFIYVAKYKVMRSIATKTGAREHRVFDVVSRVLPDMRLISTQLSNGVRVETEPAE